MFGHDVYPVFITDTFFFSQLVQIEQVVCVWSACVF